MCLCRDATLCPVQPHRGAEHFAEVLLTQGATSSTKGSRVNHRSWRTLAWSHDSTFHQWCTPHWWFFSPWRWQWYAKKVSVFELINLKSVHKIYIVSLWLISGSESLWVSTEILNIDVSMLTCGVKKRSPISAHQNLGAGYCNMLHIVVNGRQPCTVCTKTWYQCIIGAIWVNHNTWYLE